MNHRQSGLWPSVILVTAALAACGGGNTATIGGQISGLAAGNTVVLQDNGTDNITLSANGGFAFPTGLKARATYAVTVLTQPAGQMCSVLNGSGTTNATADPINTVSVTCVSTAMITGTVSGLVPGAAVTLNNGGVLLPVALNGNFSFPGVLAIGNTYNITIATQPVGENCTVSNGSGTVAAGTTINIAVSCTA
jgi:hypothetical protein